MTQLTKGKVWIVINATPSSNERYIGELSTFEKYFGCFKLTRIPKDVYCGERTQFFRSLGFFIFHKRPSLGHMPHKPLHDQRYTTINLSSSFHTAPVVKGVEKIS
jgi:hypothetical protein